MNGNNKRSFPAINNSNNKEPPTKKRKIAPIANPTEREKLIKELVSKLYDKKDNETKDDIQLIQKILDISRGVGNCNIQSFKRSITCGEMNIEIMEVAMDDKNLKKETSKLIEKNKQCELTYIDLIRLQKDWNHFLNEKYTQENFEDITNNVKQHKIKELVSNLFDEKENKTCDGPELIRCIMDIAGNFGSQTNQFKQAITSVTLNQEIMEIAMNNLKETKGVIRKDKQCELTDIDLNLIYKYWDIFRTETCVNEHCTISDDNYKTNKIEELVRKLYDQTENETSDNAELIGNIMEIAGGFGDQRDTFKEAITCVTLDQETMETAMDNLKQTKSIVKKNKKCKLTSMDLNVIHKYWELFYSATFQFKE